MKGMLHKGGRKCIVGHLRSECSQMQETRVALCRWWLAMDRVRQALPAGARLDTWQLDAYSDEPYCENFRGA